MAYFEEKELINKMQEGTNSSSYYDKYFTETSAGLDIEANNINVNCINSKNNKFSIDEEGNISCNTITTNNISSNPGGNIDFNQIYPVGSIYLSVNSLNPGTLFGGTWTQITDKFLIGAGNLYPVNSTGGATTHNHKVPTHTHVVGNHTHSLGDSGWADLFYGNASFITRELSGVGFTSNNSKTVAGAQTARNNWETYGTALGGTTAGMTSSVSTTESGQLTTENTTIIPPYLAVYIWQRIN